VDDFLLSHRFTNKYAFEKPNDRRGIDLMNAAAMAVMTELPEIVIAYGISDEYRYYSIGTPP
jgi:tRNA(His) guanylyltransferase